MRKRAVLRMLLSLVLFLGAFAAATPQDRDWPRWRGPNGDGISTETGWDPQALASGPRILWKADVGTGYSNVAIQGNRLYTLGKKDSKVWLYCLDTRRGRVIWHFQFPEKEWRDPQSTPALSGDRVYALGFDGTLVCVTAKDGKLLWTRDLVDAGALRPYYGFAGSPVIDGNLVILEANTSGMAVDRNTGTVVWKSDQPPKGNYQAGSSTGACYATPVVFEKGGKRYAAVGSYKGLFAVEGETGAPLWVFDWEKSFEMAGDQIADPIVFGDKIFFVQFYRDSPGSALLDTSGKVPKVLWTNKMMNSDYSSPVLLNGRLYICKGGSNSGFGALSCLDAATGSTLWEENLNKKPISLVAADGKLIVLDENGALFIGEPAASGFTLNSKATIPGGIIWRTSPVLCGGRIYCRDFATKLFCIDVSKR